MNKKRVAIALAAALSLNALVLNVGQVNGVQVVHALSQDAVNKLNATKFETLKTTVKNIDNKKVEVSFDNIDLGNVSSIGDVIFNHEIFSERVSIDSKVGNVYGTWKDNKLVVDGLTNPGIYTGQVVINFKDNSRKAYKLTLVKRPADHLSFSTNVTPFKMDINNVKLNGNRFTPTSATISLNGGESKNIVFNKQSGDATISLMDFGKVKEGDKFTLSVSYGKDGVYTITSEILLVKQAEPQIIQNFASNKADVARNIVDALKTQGNLNFNVSDVKVEFNDQNSTATVKLGNNTLFTYDQSKNGNFLGGGELKISNPVKSTFDVTVGEPRAISKNTIDEFGVRVDNFLPMVGVDYGSDGQAKVNETGLIGDYKFEINGKTSTYFDASKSKDNRQIKPDVDSTGNASKIVYKVDQSKENLYRNGILNAENKITVDLTNNLQHGYGSVPVNFTVDYRDDENLIYEANRKVRNSNVSGNKVEAKIQDKYKDGTRSSDTVKTSVIVLADALDAIAVNATFEKVTPSTGNVVIYGDGLKFDLNSNLTLPGASAQLDTTSSKDGKLVFRVAFNRDIVPVNTNWTLNTNGKTINGKVDLSVDVVESVNANIKIENNINTTDTFKVTPEFMNVYVKDGLKTFIGANNNEINPSGIRFSDLSLNNGNAIRSTITQGKFQGKYDVGVWSLEQPMNLQITNGESKSSGTANITIDANFINHNDYKNVTGARIEYREKAVDNKPVRNWLTAGIVFNLPNNSSNSDIKEEPITKTITGLVDGKEYEFRVRYTYKDKGNETFIYSNVVTVKIANTNSSVGSVVIPVTPHNSTYDPDTTSIIIPPEVNYGANKSTKIVSISYKDKNGNIVTEPSYDYSNVTIKFNNEKIVIDGLVPGKQYEEIVFNYIDHLGLTRTIIVKNPKTFATRGTSYDYLANFYNVTFGRPADEGGYHFHHSRLVSKQTALRSFLLNMLSEKEFTELYKQPETKIEALYNAIVARTSDEAGKRFWVNEYKKMLPVYGSEIATLKAIADRMVNEPELKELAIKLGFQI